MGLYTMHNRIGKHQYAVTNRPRQVSGRHSTEVTTCKNIEVARRLWAPWRDLRGGARAYPLPSRPEVWERRKLSSGVWDDSPTPLTVFCRSYYWHDTVVCPSVCDAVHCEAKVRCRVWKLYNRLYSHRAALPIHFFRHFCCRVYRKPHIAVWRVVQTQHKHSKKPSVRAAEIPAYSHVTVVISDAAFSAVPFYSCV